MRSSPSVTKRVSCLIIEDHRGADRAHRDAAGEEMADQLVAFPPAHCLVDRRAPRLAMANDARATGLHALRMDKVHLDEAHPFVRIARADLCPRQRLGDLRGKCLDSTHGSIILDQGIWSSSRSLLPHPARAGSVSAL